MEYTKTNVNAFGGLDANKRPELLQNEQASDIENLRFDKIGYLINRNGVQAKPLQMTKTVAGADIKNSLWPIGTLGMTEYVLRAPWGINSGTNSWEPYDTATLGLLYPNSPNVTRHSDRFMVYQIRIPSAFETPQGSSTLASFDSYDRGQYTISGSASSPENHYTWRYKAAYVLVPLTGPDDFRDTVAIAPNGLPYVGFPSSADLDYPSMLVTIGARSILRADDKPSRTQIYAPQRWLGVHNTFEHDGIPKDQNWIEHYTSMHQYRDTIVISDMTNKDLQLVDEYSEAEYNEERKHRFTLRENALAKFDVDDVVIDFGLGAGNFNDGVEAPMALYRFYLPKSNFTETEDNFNSVFENRSSSPSYEQVVKEYGQVVDASFLNLGDDDYVNYWTGYSHTETKALFTTEYWEEIGSKTLGVLDVGTSLGASTTSTWVANGSCITFNTSQKYVFTNNESADEYDDLMGTVTLKNPDIKQDDQVSSDVYSWDDMLIKYYPSSGVNNTNAYFLTARDRNWNKSSSTSSRVVKLKTKKDVEQDVPLGVWRYRFIWYLGNGEYSAPSAELVVPDIIFSAIRDTDIAETGITYTRPIGINDQEDSYRTNLELQYTNFLNKNTSLQHLKMFAGATLAPTAFGSNFIKVKEKLYKPGHVFAAKYSSTNGASWPTSWVSESNLAKGQVAVSCTLRVSGDTLTLRGTAGESCVSVLNNAYRPVTSPLGQTIDYFADNYMLEVVSYQSSKIQLELALFPLEYNSCTYNSLFTKYGNIRTTIQNHQRYSSNALYSSNIPSYQIIFEGEHAFGVSRVTSALSTASRDEARIDNEVARNGKRVFVNVVPFQTRYNPIANTVDLERNNEDDDVVYPPATTTKRWEYRNMTVARGIKDSDDRLIRFDNTVPAEVIDRLLLSGYAEIKVCDYTDNGTWSTQKMVSSKVINYNLWNDPGTTKDRHNRYTYNIFPEESSPTIPGTEYASRFFARFQDAAAHNIAHDGQYFTTHGDHDTLVTCNLTNFFSFVPVTNEANNYKRVELKNVKIVASFPGERLTIAEQLSMYVPASFLFKAPHVKLIIPSDRIPRRARQLMIFRTRASHDNAWQPHDYGFVKAIDIIRDKDTGLPSGTHLQKVEFLDDVKSEDMDFSYNLTDYEGFTEPIASRFCLPLNERVFYANIKESYRPKAPRNAVKIVANPADVSQVSHKNLNVGSLTEIERLWSYRFFLGEDETTNINKRYLYYFLAYNDAARSYSLASYSGMIDRGLPNDTAGNPNNLPNKNKKVMMYCLPSAYDQSVEHVNIYRFQSDTALSIVPFTGRQSTLAYPSVASPNTGYFYVAQGVVEYNGVVYFPNSVIKTEHGGDTGVPPNPVATGFPTYMNRFVNYFSQTTAPYQPLGKTNRGAMATYCEPIIYDITSFFDTTTNPSGYLEKIGDIVPENEGIFYDDDLPSIGRVPLLQFFQNQDIMPAGLRWSEPYQPNKIKLGSLMEVRSGDGDQITGMAQLYGNIIILKERSIHRLAVQGSSVPVSRVDEISNNVGCIAPNTVITVDNTLYFLSWSGFYRYDNNVLSRVDGAFAEELQVRLRSNIDGVMNPAIRDASCGWNPTYREIYLNIPVMSADNNEGHYGVASITGDHNQGITLMDNTGERKIRAMVYAINIDTGFVSKYRYMDDALYFTDPNGFIPTVLFPNATTQRAPRVSSRMYFTNTLGQMRSAECLPPRTYYYGSAFKPGAYQASISYLQTNFYIESPTKEANTSFDKYQDDMFMYIQPNPAVPSWSNGINTRNVRVFWQSKSFTGDDKTVLKRVRKVFSYISSNVQPAVIRGIVHTSPSGAKMTSDTVWEYSYWFTDPLSPAYGQSATGELSAIPTEAAGSSTSASQNRGERHLFQVEGGGSFQMEYFGFYWKPVNTYQR